MPLCTGVAQALIVLFAFAFPAISAGLEHVALNDLESLRDMEVPIVTGASKYQQEVTDAPASVTVIGSDEIRMKGYRNLAEALNSVRGFYTLYNRIYQFAGTQGFSPLGDYNARILLLIDGHRLNDAVFEGAPLGSDFPVDMDLIDRIEVIRGPGSSLYGSNAFMAVINVITKNGKDLKGGELSSSGGSYNAWTGRVTGGGKTDGGVDYLFSGSYRNAAGKQRLSFPEYSPNGGIARGRDGETSWDLLAKAGWKDLSFIVLHQTRDKDIPTAPFYTVFNDSACKISNRHTLAGLFYDRTGGFADVSARITYNRSETVGDYPYPNSDISKNWVLEKDVVTGEWIGSDLLVSKNIGEHLVMAGMEHRWQFTQRQKVYDIAPYLLYVDLNERNLIQGYYLQDEYHVMPGLILNAGLRFDNYQNVGSTLNPRAALIWRPYDGTVVRLSYGEAFRAPNAYELSWNPDLKPEKLRSSRLEWDQFIGANIRTTAAGFYNRISNLVEQTNDSERGLIYKLSDRVESRGIELQAEGAWENGVSGRLSYCYQEARNQDTNKILANSPRNIAKASLTVPLPALKKHFATIEMVYGGSRLNADGESIAGAAIVNLTLLSRELVKGLDVSASVYNLFDKKYSMPATAGLTNSLEETLSRVGQDGITFRIKANWRF